MTQKNKKVWPEIDALYTIGTVLVILGHSHSSDWSTFSHTILEPLIAFIYTFHMPLFFFISGFLFNNSSSLEKTGYFNWSKQKSIRLLTPYIVISLVSFLPKYFVENRSFDGLSLTHIAELIFVPRKSVWGHFWFLPTLLTIYLVFGLFNKFLKGEYRNVFLVISGFSSIVLYFLPVSTDILGFNDLKKNICFFVFGIVVNTTIYRTKSKLPVFGKILFIISGTCLCIALSLHFLENDVLMLPVALIMIFICWQFATLIKDSKISKFISKNNFTMYIYSWPIQSVVMLFTEKLFSTWYITTISMFLSGIFCPLLIAIIYKHATKLNNKFFDLILGVK